jgi:hypothetical protein
MVRDASASLSMTNENGSAALVQLFGVSKHYAGATALHPTDLALLSGQGKVFLRQSARLVRKSRHGLVGHVSTVLP